jgi:hypothetical protein
MPARSVSNPSAPISRSLREREFETSGDAAMLTPNQESDLWLALCFDEQRGIKAFNSNGESRKMGSLYTVPEQKEYIGLCDLYSLLLVIHGLYSSNYIVKCREFGK